MAGVASAWTRRSARGGEPGGRERERLDPAVVGRGLALDEPARLEPVDEPGDVRRVAAELGGEGAHGPGLRGVEGLEGPDLTGRDRQLDADRVE